MARVRRHLLTRQKKYIMCEEKFEKHPPTPQNKNLPPFKCIVPHSEGKLLILTYVNGFNTCIFWYNGLMKIRYYHVAKNRWWGFAIAMASIFILSDVRWFYNSIAQVIGWSFASISCGFWVYIGMNDKDIPRTLMELMYFVLALRAVYNWLQ